MHIHALHLGPIQTLQYAGKTVRTAGNKESVASAWLTPNGLRGDQQADRRYHGGPDRALCGYGWEHYAEVAGAPRNSFGRRSVQRKPHPGRSG